MSNQQLPTGNSRPIALRELFFDPENPRLPGGKRTGDEDRILLWMLQKGDLIELMDSIASTGYSDAEPLLVTPNPKGSGYIVVEGNRRLAALKLLASPQLASLRKKTVFEIANNSSISEDSIIPTIVYSNRRDILDYLGFRHITGVKPWGPREKAEYLRQLYNFYKDSTDNVDEAIAIVSKMIGTKPYYAKRLLDTLDIVEWAEDNAFWGSEEVQGAIDKNFSVFHTALSYDGIRAYIGMKDFINGNIDNIDYKRTRNIIEWICGEHKLISDSRELKLLNTALGKQESAAMLEKGASLYIASEYTEEVLNNFHNLIQKGYEKLQDADRLTSRLKRIDNDDVSLMDDIIKLCEKIHDYISRLK